MLLFLFFLFFHISSCCEMESNQLRIMSKFLPKIAAFVPEKIGDGSAKTKADL